MRVAAAQMVSGTDLDANFAVASSLLKEAAADGASLVVLPENFGYMGRNDRERLKVAETPREHPTENEPMQAFLHCQAIEHQLWIVGGTLPLRSADEDRVSSATLVYAPDGRLVARYNKIHLFDVDVPDSKHRYRESKSTIPGEKALTTDVGGMCLGLSVCYDLRFPELFRTMAGTGCDCFAISSAFTVPTGEAHWEVLVRARAIENLTAVVAACQGGHHSGGRETYGHSMIVDAWGRVLGVRQRGAGIVIADIDFAAQRRLRKTFPVLDHRRVIEVEN